MPQSYNNNFEITNKNDKNNEVNVSSLLSSYYINKAEKFDRS